MANMNLVTGYAGQDHVSAADAGSLHAAVFGNGQYVLNNGNNLSASAINGNQVRVHDGDILMQGRHIRINPNTYVDLTLENGTTGYKRHDLIIARYTRDTSTGQEEANLAVIKGTADSVVGADPSYTSGNIISGNAVLNEMPLYRVVFDGLTIASIEPLFETFGQLGSHTTNRNNPHGVTIKQIGAAADNHNHTLDSLNGTLSVEKGGTGATKPEDARTKLGITPGNIGASASNHNHTIDSLKNMHVVSKKPTTFENGHWYLVKED